MTELKQQGYDAVVSLLHPAIAPHEPKLLAEEKELAKEFGIELIETPMLPWMSEDDEESLKTMRELVHRGKRRYYVHCYLGKDRTNVAGRVLAAAGGRVEGFAASESRDIRKMPGFERGEIYVLEEGVYLTPYPTDEEYFGFILAGPIQHVVSLWDPKAPDLRRWAERERQLLRLYALPLEEMPIEVEPYDPYRALEVARRVRRLPRPVVVHAFWTELARAPEVEAFVQAYTSGVEVPPLPPALFQDAMRDGKVEVIATNLAVGPRPTPTELRDYLHRKGVRALIFLGPKDSPPARFDRKHAQKAGLRWQSILPHDAALWETVSSGGPWYLYGPGLEQVREDLAARLGPALPELKTAGPSDAN